MKAKKKGDFFMKETCFYCYYHSRCSGLSDPEYICAEWRPALVPARAVEALYWEFFEKASEVLSHVYSDTQRETLKKYLLDKGDILSQVLELYESREFPTLSYSNENYKSFKKRGL